MRRSALVVSAVLAALGTRADAEPVPGTAGDPLRELMIEPAFTSSELGTGLAIRGGGPEDTVLLFDGFELPWAFHEHGLRSIVAPGAVDAELFASGFGVEYGRGSSIVTLSPRNAQQSIFGELTVVDVHGHSGAGSVSSSIRVGHDVLADAWRASEGGTFTDALAHFDIPLTKSWTLQTSAIGSLAARAGPDRTMYRLVTGVHYKSRTWLASLAVSPLSRELPDSSRFSIDTRGEVIRHAALAAGLRKLEWRLGQQTNTAHHDLPTTAGWRTDIGLWSSVAANLSSRIRASAGVRADSFAGDVATQPRASLSAFATRHLELTVAGGAYRRPPSTDAELAVSTLHPERATHVVAGATLDTNHGYRITGAAYYIDRRRLIARDDAGVLGNTGFGSSTGAELSARVREGPWFARLTSALSRSRRTDYLRGRERSAPYEQPVRLELVGAWTHKALTISGRLQLASGLPYTPYAGSIYDSDTDTFTPLYVEPLSARTPFHHQVDLRVDYRFTLGSVPCNAFVDLHNAYANRDAIAYRYAYDYRDRVAISALPLFPFAGLRAYL